MFVWMKSCHYEAEKQNEGTNKMKKKKKQSHKANQSNVEKK